MNKWPQHRLCGISVSVGTLIPECSIFWSWQHFLFVRSRHTNGFDVLQKKVENTDVEGNVQFFQSRKSKAVKTCFLCVVLELFPISFSTQSSLTLSRTQREEEPQVTDDFSLLSWGWNRIYLLFPKGLNVLLSNNITPLCHCWRVVSKTLLYQQQKANYVKSYIQKRKENTWQKQSMKKIKM